MRLIKEARADLHVWSVFIEHFIDKSVFLPDQWITSDILNLSTDASYTGYGDYLNNEWFAGEWPETWKYFHITVKECFQ